MLTLFWSYRSLGRFPPPSLPMIIARCGRKWCRQFGCTPYWALGFFSPFYEKEVTFSCFGLQLQMVWEEEFNVSSWHTNPLAPSKWPSDTLEPPLFDKIHGTPKYTIGRIHAFQWYSSSSYLQQWTTSNTYGQTKNRVGLTDIWPTIYNCYYWRKHVCHLEDPHH